MNFVLLSPLQNQQATEAIKVCTEVLQLEPTNVNALKDRAEAYLLEDLYEEGTVVSSLCILFCGRLKCSQCFKNVLACTLILCHVVIPNQHW